MSTATPLVSVGVPVYNGERFIARTLDSLLAQDYPNLEVVVSDNCSTDRTAEVCRGYADRDPRVRFSSTDRNRGVNPNYHRVLDLARGEYFMWTACDDFWKPAAVTALVRELEAHPEAALAASAAEFVTPDGRYLETITQEGMPVNGVTSFQLFKMIQYEGPFWIYLYGLFRRRFLQAVLRQPLPDIFDAESIVLAEIALATQFRYVDQPLQVRTKHAKTNPERYPDEPSYRLKHQWSRERCNAILGERITRSRLIPGHRKALALLWMKLRHLDRQAVPGGSVLRRLYSTVSHKLG